MGETKAVFRNLVLGAAQVTVFATLIGGVFQSFRVEGAIAVTSRGLVAVIGFFCIVLAVSTLLQLASYYLPIRPVAKTEERGSR